MVLSQLVCEYLDEYFETCFKNNEPVEVGRLYHTVLQEVERALFIKALKMAQGNRTRAANFLGIHRNTFRKKMVALALV